MPFPNYTKFFMPEDNENAFIDYIISETDEKQIRQYIDKMVIMLQQKDGHPKGSKAIMDQAIEN